MDGYLRVSGGYVLAPTGPHAHLLKQCIAYTEDGVPLAVYESLAPTAATMLVALPLGVPVAAITPAINELAKSYHVVTWESRGYPSIADDFDHVNTSFDAHVRDLLLVRELFGTPETYLLGYCGGGAVSLKATTVAPALFRKVIVVAGYLNLFDVFQTATTQNMTQAFDRLSRNRQAAAHLGAALKEFILGAPTQRYNGIPNKSDFMKLLNCVYDDSELTFRFSKLLSNSYAERVSSWLDSVRNSVLLISIADDEIVPTQWATYAHAHLINSSLLVCDTGGHWAWCKSGTIVDAIKAWVANATTEPPGASP
jgi:pimeloyl-ACP methyl ester carboxylesterase